TPAERRRTGVRPQPLHRSGDASRPIWPSIVTRTGSGEPQAGRHQTEGWGAEVEQLGVEALQGVLGAPGGPRLLPQAEDLQLAPRVAAVGGVEGGARRFAARR